VGVIGIIRGYEFIQDFSKENPGLIENVHYISISDNITGIRNRTGIVLRTSRANPGKGIRSVQDLGDPARNLRLRNIMDALDHLGAGALVSIGGDDT
jgi:6-phosphofructokinase